jgi:hypothetical protein
VLCVLNLQDELKSIMTVQAWVRMVSTELNVVRCN